MRPVNELRASSVNTMPVKIDWYKIPYERYITYVWQKCTQCSQEGWFYYHICENCRCLDEGAGEPVTNYYYPLDISAACLNVRQGVKSIAHLPLSIIWMDGQIEYVLAISQTLWPSSWDIAEGFMRLGLLPPVCILPLPGTPRGMPTETAVWILEGAVRSLLVQQEKAQSALEDVQNEIEILKYTGAKEEV